MPRITVDISDATLAQIDAEVKLQKVSRSKWAATAIDAYLQQERITSDAEVHQLEERVMQLQQQLDAKNNEIDTLQHRSELMHTDADVMQETHQLKDLLEAKDKELTSLKTEDEKKWRETSQLRSEASQLKREIESTRAKIDQLQRELDTRRSEAEQARSAAESMRNERDRLSDALRIKDDDVAWLRGHVAQLTQQLALPPSQEEAKKKGWWRFWK
jgi:Small-conductance mechanosensitive channel